MITENLNIVEYIVRHEVIKSKCVVELEYDDLYQTGCIALCRAAATYDGRVKFITYASKVIRNAMIDYLRKIPTANISLDAPIYDEDNYCLKDSLASDENIETNIMQNNIYDILSESKKAYSGVVLKGIEAIEFKLKGYSGAEIAELYGVKCNHVSAWISKAVKKLKENSEFMSSAFDI